MKNIAVPYVRSRELYVEKNTMLFPGPLQDLA